MDVYIIFINKYLFLCFYIDVEGLRYMKRLKHFREETKPLLFKPLRPFKSITIIK